MTKEILTSFSLSIITLLLTASDHLLSCSWARLHSVLPNTHQQLQPKVVSQREVHAGQVHQQQQQRRYYDRSARPLPPLQEGQHIRFQEQGQWKPAVVIRPAETDCSYHIRSAEGPEYRRNRCHLLSTNEGHHTYIDKSPEDNTPQTPHNSTLSTSQIADEILPHTNLTRQDLVEKSSLQLFWTCNTM